MFIFFYDVSDCVFVMCLPQQSHLFDNVATVFFAIFMGIWGKYEFVMFFGFFFFRCNQVLPLVEVLHFSLVLFSLTFPSNC